MSRKILLAFWMVFLVGCGGRGVYLYQEKGGAARYDLDRPWVIIGQKGVGSKRLEQKLCSEGELRAILEDAHLDTSEEDALFGAACGSEASAVRFLQIYYGLERDKRNRLRESFRRHGYTLNDYGC